MSKERTSSLLPIIKRARKELLPSCLLSNGEGKNLSKEPLSLLPIIKRRRKEPLERTSFPLTYYQTAKERTSRKNLFPSYLLSNGEGKNLSKEPLSLLPIIKRARKELLPS